MHEFTPPQLSFTESDYFASLGDGNVVKSVQDHSDNGDVAGNNDVPWTVFQAVSSTASKESIQRRSGPLLTLFPGVPSTTKSTENTIDIGAYSNNNRHSKHAVLTPAEQRTYLETHGKKCYTASSSMIDILSQYDKFVKSPTLSNLAIELWKYCALYVEGGVYVDAETAPLAALGDILAWDNINGGGTKNYVVVATTRDAGVSPSLLNGVDSTISDSVTMASSVGTGNPVAMSSMIAIGTKEHSIPKQMIVKLMETNVETLEEDAMLLPRTLMSLVNKDNENTAESWGLLKQRCNGIEIASGDEGHRTLRHCPASSGYCCEILDPSSNFVFLLSRQSLVPNQILPSTSLLPQPYNHADFSSTSTPVSDKELAFMSTIKEETSSPLLSSKPGSAESTPNVYEILQSQHALPSQESNKQACMDCLREKKGADCTICAEKCPNFCSKLCEVEVNEKPVTRVLTVVPPRYKKDPERIIPRIVHQVSLLVLLLVLSFCNFFLKSLNSLLCLISHQMNRHGLNPSLLRNTLICLVLLNHGNVLVGSITFGMTILPLNSYRCTFHPKFARPTIPYCQEHSRRICSVTVY